MYINKNMVAKPLLWSHRLSKKKEDIFVTNYNYLINYFLTNHNTFSTLIVFDNVKQTVCHFSTSCQIIDLY